MGIQGHAGRMRRPPPGPCGTLNGRPPGDLPGARGLWHGKARPPRGNRRSRGGDHWPSSAPTTTHLSRAPPSGGPAKQHRGQLLLLREPAGVAPGMVLLDPGLELNAGDQVQQLPETAAYSICGWATPGYWHSVSCRNVGRPVWPPLRSVMSPAVGHGLLRPGMPLNPLMSGPFICRLIPIPGGRNPI